MALPIRSFPKMLAQRLLVDLELIGDFVRVRSGAAASARKNEFFFANTCTG
jgi:hypothetical protein